MALTDNYLISEMKNKSSPKSKIGPICMENWRTWNTCLGAATKQDKFANPPASFGAKSKLCFGNNIT